MIEVEVYLDVECPCGVEGYDLEVCVMGEVVSSYDELLVDNYSLELYRDGDFTSDDQEKCETLLYNTYGFIGEELEEFIERQILESLSDD